MFIATVDWPSEELSFNCLAMHEAGGAGVQVATDMCSVICRDPNIRTVHNFMNEYLYTSMHTYHKYIHIYLHKYIYIIYKSGCVCTVTKFYSECVEGPKN